MSGPSLSERLTGHTVVFDAPEGLPAERETYHPDGTLTRMFRPILVPDRLSTNTGYWWIESGRYCASGLPRTKTDKGSCYTVSVSDDRIHFTPWRPATLITLFPDLRKPRDGRIVE